MLVQRVLLSIARVGYPTSRVWLPRQYRAKCSAAEAMFAPGPGGPAVRLTRPIANATLDVAWLTPDRATAWVRTLAVVTLAVGLVWIALSPGGLDPTGKPLGTDFIAFWSAARMMLDGAPAAAAYDTARHAAAESAAFPGATNGYAPFVYPPIFLLVCMPLGALPYLPSLAAWLAATGYAYWRTARAWLGQTRGLALPALAFPAVLINAGHGQNGFLSVALFGTGALLLRSRPFVAGLCLGALAYKPHLGLLIPIALAASRNWRAFGGAAVAALALTAASAVAFGLDAWRGLPTALQLVRRAVETGELGAGKVQSVFEAARLAHASLPLAYAAQALTAAAVAALVAAFAYRRPRSPALGPVLIAATLLVSPYLLDYDLMLAAIPLAWLFADGKASGFRTGDKAVMLAAFILPLVARLIGMRTGVVIAPAVLFALLAITVRRGWDGPPVASARLRPAQPAIAEAPMVVPGATRR